AGVGDTLSRNVKSRAVVHTGPDEGQAHRYIDALIHAQVLDRNQALVVVLRHYDVEFAPARTHEYRVAGPGTAGVYAFVPGLFDGRRNHLDLFLSEPSFFPGVRIQSGDGDAWLPYARLQAGALRQ